MQLEHSFTVPVGVEQAWGVLMDIERVAPCMPGAVLDSIDGDSFTGRVKIKLGPVNLTYKGTASFVEKDEEARRAVIDASGKDARGNGTAAAKVTATLVAQGEDSTEVKVVTDLNITGRPAQFGRGVMVDVGNKLIGQFATCLEGKLAGGPDEPDAGASAASTSDTGATGDATSDDSASDDSKADDAKSDDAGSAADDGTAAGGSPAGSTAAGSTTAAASTAKPSAPKAAAAKPAATPPAEPEPIDLLELAGSSALLRAVPIAAGGVLLALLFFLLGRRTAR